MKAPVYPSRMNRDRLHQLNLKRRSMGSLTDAEEEEIDRLYEELRSVKIAATPHPKCCAKALRYRTVYFSVQEVYDVCEPKEGRWRPVYIPMDWDPNVRDTPWYEGLPDAKFCGFCGELLPKMTRLKTPPQPLCRITDGGYYCDTCEQSLEACECLPPSAAFGPG
jgi:hypothetical protein